MELLSHAGSLHFSRIASENIPTFFSQNLTQLLVSLTPVNALCSIKVETIEKKWWLEVQFKSMALFSTIKKAMKAVAVRMIACKKLVLIAQQSVVSCQLCPIVFFLVPVK